MTVADQVEVLVRRFDPELPLPEYAQASDAGADLRSAQDVTLGPGERAVVPTGVGVALPPGYAAFVHPRSGLAARHGLSVVNAPGTIDAGYRGEIKVIVLNTDRRETIHLRRGDRIAQLVVQRVAQAVFHPVDALPDSERGSGGFGSTGGFGSQAPVPVADGDGQHAADRHAADRHAADRHAADAVGETAGTRQERSGDDVRARR